MPAPTLLPPASGVKVRMYRHGLGDCLLLAFATNQPGKAYYVMIDCGLMWATHDESKVLRAVVEDVIKATGGELHLLALSHEHWDHIGGFTRAKAAFARLKVHNLWLAWTEGNDAQAVALRKRLEKDLEGLALAYKRTAATPLGQQIGSVLSFFGGLGASDFSPATRQALEDARALVPDEAHRACLDPGGTPLTLPAVGGLAVPDVGVYVLGPSRDESFLEQTDGPETYEDAAALTPRTAFTMALRDQPEPLDEDYERYELSMPFSQGLRIPPDEAKKHPFFRAHYAADDDSAWRRIDADWLGTAGELALQADKLTNNSSLVLAFRLAKSNRVLLFSGDAQVGNWVSWAKQTWTLGQGASAVEVRAEYLLTHAAFYKVGHHGSHNATVRSEQGHDWGLALMNGPDLVALVPTNAEQAHAKGWPRMPFEPLLDALAKKTHGRTVRADLGLPAARPAGTDPGVWTAFTAAFEQTEGVAGYIQVTIPDAAP